MKLNSTLVETTLSQFEAQVIPDTHPAASELNRLFGDHTFFLDRNGLNIVEPAAPAPEGAEAGQIVNLANWDNTDPPSLTPHAPESPLPRAPETFERFPAAS